MSEGRASTETPSSSTSSSTSSSSSSVNDEFDAAAVLEHVKALLASGDAHGAFAVLLHLVKNVHPSGEDGILGVLDTAKDLLSRQRQLEQVDEMNVSLHALRDLLDAPSLLAEEGSEDILRDAFVDGSSVVCRRCGDLVKRERFDLHQRKWCSALPTENDDEDDEDV